VQARRPSFRDDGHPFAWGRRLLANNRPPTRSAYVLALALLAYAVNARPPALYDAPPCLHEPPLGPCSTCVDRESCPQPTCGNNFGAPRPASPAEPPRTCSTWPRPRSFPSPRGWSVQASPADRHLASSRLPPRRPLSRPPRRQAKESRSRTTACFPGPSRLHASRARRPARLGAPSPYPVSALNSGRCTARPVGRCIRQPRTAKWSCPSPTPSGVRGAFSLKYTCSWCGGPQPADACCRRFDPARLWEPTVMLTPPQPSRRTAHAE